MGYWLRHFETGRSHLKRKVCFSVACGRDLECPPQRVWDALRGQGEAPEASPAGASTHLV